MSKGCCLLQSSLDVWLVWPSFALEQGKHSKLDKKNGIRPIIGSGTDGRGDCYSTPNSTHIYGSHHGPRELVANGRVRDAHVRSARQHGDVFPRPSHISIYIYYIYMFSIHGLVFRMYGWLERREFQGVLRRVERVPMRRVRLIRQKDKPKVLIDSIVRFDHILVHCAQLTLEPITTYWRRVYTLSAGAIGCCLHTPVESI